MDFLSLALLVVLVLGGLALLSAAILAFQRARLPPPCAFVDAEGVRLHYCEMGAGTPLVLLHGSNGSCNDFRLSIMPGLSQEFRAVALDRPGHGYSQRPDGAQVSCACHGDMALAAWKRLGMERPILLGHSSAGAVLMDLALRRPEEISALVLVSGVVHSFHEGLAPVRIYRPLLRPYLGTFLLWTVLIPLGAAAGRGILRLAFDPDPVPKAYGRQALALALRPSSLRAEAEDLKCLSPTLRAIEDRYPEMDLPVVIVVGDRDRAVPPESEGLRLHRELPRSELVVLEGTGHMPMLTRPEEVIAAVRRARELSCGKKGGASLKLPTPIHPPQRGSS